MSEAYELHEKIKEFLELRAFVALKTFLSEQNPVDIAEALDGLEERDISLCFRLLDKEQGKSENTRRQDAPQRGDLNI